MAIEGSKEELVVESPSEQEEEETQSVVEDEVESQVGQSSPTVTDSELESEMSGFDSDVGSSWVSLQGHDGDLKTPSV